MIQERKETSGQIGEALACRFLEDKGYSIVERNFHFGTAGEIDIIALDGEILVFVEVKLRKSNYYGEPEEAITRSKIAQVRKIAAGYLYVNNIRDRYCRFDVIAIRSYPEQETDIRHYIDAF